MLSPSPAGLDWLHDRSHLVFFFLVAWAFFAYLTALIGGWDQLAGKFRAQGEFEGDKWRFRSAHMRYYTHYGNIVTVGANRSGLYLSLFPVFRLGHPPLLVPWSEITVLRGEAGIFFFSQRMLLLGREERIPLRISASLTHDLRQAAGPAWPIETLSP